MQASLDFTRQVFATLIRQRRPLLLYHLFFSVLAATLLVPATRHIMTLVLTQSGQRAVTNHDVVTFLLSPLGLAWCLTGATLLLLLITLQRAGMIVIAAEHDGNAFRQVMTALVHVVRKSPRLFRLALVRAAAHVALAAPFLIAIYALHASWLGDYEHGWVMRERPPAFWLFIATALPFAMALVVLGSTLYVRWLLALPCVMLEHSSVRGALRRSHRLVSGHRVRLVFKALLLAVAVISLPGVLVFVFENLAALVLDRLPDRFGILVPATLAVLALYLLFAFILAFLGIGAGSVFVQVAHRRASGHHREPLHARQPERAGLLSWSVELLLIAFVAWQVLGVLEHFRLEDDVAIIAHRGSSLAAPENSIAAIERAIDEHADYLEIDVRQSADGTPVLMHDADLARVAGIERRVAELSVAELARVDIGSRLGERHARETIPTLQEALAHASGRIVPFIDIKADAEASSLVRRTVSLLRESGLLDEALIGAATPAVLHEVRRHAPGVKTALFIHVGIGAASLREFDVLGVRAATVTPEFIVRAHRNGHAVFVFTVNGRAEMARFIDMGVDGIITDSPALLAELLAERAALSEGELLVVKLRHWLRN